jgi:hypothetical protein
VLFRFGEFLSPPLQRHQALQFLELARLLDDGEPIKPFGWIAGEHLSAGSRFGAAGL